LFHYGEFFHFFVGGFCSFKTGILGVLLFLLTINTKIKLKSTTQNGNQSLRPNVNSPDQLAAGGPSYGADNQLAPLWHDELASLSCH